MRFSDDAHEDYLSDEMLRIPWQKLHQQQNAAVKTNLGNTRSLAVRHLISFWKVISDVVLCAAGLTEFSQTVAPIRTHLVIKQSLNLTDSGQKKIVNRGME